MATQTEYDAVTIALQKAILAEEQAEVPAWERGMIPADLVPNLAKLCGKIAVDTLDKIRNQPKSS